MKLGIFLPNWVGDACMATPAIRALRHGLARNARFVAIGRPASVEVLGGSSWFDHKITYRPRGSADALSRSQLVVELRRQKLDTIVLLTNSWSTAFISALSGTRRRIGYSRDLRGWMLTDSIAVPKVGWKRRPIAAIDYYMKIAEHMGCPSVERAMELAVERSDVELADQLWDRCGLHRSTPTVVINSSGAFGQSKVWPKAHVIQLAKRLAAEKGLQVLLHCGPSERKQTNEMALECQHSMVQSMGVMESLPLGLSKAILSRADIVVSTDSGPRHMAVALNRTVISLFGSTEPSWTTTYNRPETLLMERLDCQPCYARTCPLKHHHCMQKLSVDRVFRAVENQLRVGNDTIRRQAA